MPNREQYMQHARVTCRARHGVCDHSATMIRRPHVKPRRHLSTGHPALILPRTNTPGVNASSPPKLVIYNNTGVSLSLKSLMPILRLLRPFIPASAASLMPDASLTPILRLLRPFFPASIASLMPIVFLLP